MTQEEKARAYDEALKQAKFYHGNCPSEPERKKLEKMFPVLHESDDERIGNVIYCIVRDNKEVKRILEGNGVSVDNALAYLEKQKDIEDRWIEDREQCFWNGVEEGKMLAEKQKEQKHPNGCFTCDEYKKGYEEGRRNGFTAGYNKAMKEVEQKEQKPVVTLGETYHVDTLGTQQVIAGKMPQKPAE